MFYVDCRVLNILASDRYEHNVTRVASADSEMKTFVSAAFLSRAGSI